MDNADLISNLEYIRLDMCSEWETLPSFGQLPHLKSLYLWNMPKAKRLDYKFHGNDKVSVFPSLEVLSMKGLQVLEDWFDGAGAGAGAAAYDCFFPCLTELFLDNCPNLQELPYLPPKLKNMHIERVGWKAPLNCKQGSNNCCGISKSIPLECLEVLSCSNITYLLQADARLEALRKLRIGGCPNLISLGGLLQVESGIEKSLRELTFRGLESLQFLLPSMERLASLKILRVGRVPQLQQLLHIPASLEEIHLEDLESLQCLPTSLSAISSLKELRLDSIPLLKSLPDLPSSLCSLSLGSLDNLQCLPSSLSAISSLVLLDLDSIPLLKSLPDLPSSLKSLCLHDLDNLHCLPSSLSAISSLKKLDLNRIPLLESLPELTPSLNSLSLCRLDNLQCLPSSLLAISSLNRLEVNSIPLLKSLPELPPALNSLSLCRLNNLVCLPSSLSAISSLKRLNLDSIPLLKSLPHLPSSLKSIIVENCHPELKRYKKVSGSDWHEIAHLPNVRLYCF
ncbi:disease resistance protein RML1A-like [Phalaenopsis equestris]|uniref:disease resistance protein RML1A-like n=1 Tax=Phalaenopsis equestris TaxID=78828 RepID=UPI0009E2E6B1|nr:disease resistance protein RML1A-like [Phalaenopsis equestris]